MDQLAKDARNLLTKANTDLDFAKRQVERVEKNCNHDWIERFDPIHTAGYTIPGDPPGTMGIDWRGPTYVPSKTEDRWVRDCKKCGKHEETKQANVQKIEKKIPRF